MQNTLIHTLDGGATGNARPASTDHPVPVSTRLAGAAFTDRSGTIASGSTSQEVAAANTARRYLFIQNHSDTNMWVNFGTAAVAAQPSVLLYANGGFFEPLVPPTASVNIICASSGKAFTCKEA